MAATIVMVDREMIESLGKAINVHQRASTTVPTAACNARPLILIDPLLAPVPLPTHVPIHTPSEVQIFSCQWSPTERRSRQNHSFVSSSPARNTSPFHSSLIGGGGRGVVPRPTRTSRSPAPWNRSYRRPRSLCEKPWGLSRARGRARARGKGSQVCG
jgi:hypothetical protein